MPFQKGNQFGQGRPPVIDKELQSLLEGKRAYIKAVIDKFMSMNKLELARITEAHADEMPLIESWLMKIIEKGHNDNDLGVLLKLTEASYGALNQPELLTTEQRLALSLYDKWRQEQIAHLRPPSVDGESDK